MLKGKHKRPSPRRKNRSEHQAISEITWLSENAPFGAYCVDKPAEELFAIINRNPETAHTSRTDFIRSVRREISLAAKFAAMGMKNYFIREPQVFRSTKRLFRDLNSIKKLIERNKGLDKGDLIFSTKQIPYSSRKAEHEAIDDLILALPRTANVIAKILATFKPRGNPGNYDPLTRGFIFQVFERWEKLILTEGWPDENRVFLRLLVAAWRDFKFPTKEERGQGLEEWLSDRLRKQFPEGVSKVRTRNQELASSD